MTYFVLGSHPSLSIAEISATLDQTSDFSSASAEVLLLEADGDAKQLNEKLAGTIKAGSIIDKATIEPSKEHLASLLAKHLPAESMEKIRYGISIYNLDNPKLYKTLKKMRKALGLEVKKLAKQAGTPIRFVDSKETGLSSVVVKTNKLLETGADFCLIATKTGLLIGKTEGVQDFKAWSDRDYGRPARDAKSGMLPPKLARMMLNLARSPDSGNGVLLDPFCGSGTVLMEALLAGYTQVIGSDISEKAVADSQENLAWFQSRQTDNQGEVRIFQSPVEDISAHIEEPVDAIVAETFLGPPLTGAESDEQIQKNTAEILSIHETGLREIKQVLKDSGRAVLAFPAFSRKTGMIHLPLKELLGKTGLEVMNPLPERIPREFAKRTPNGGLLYKREGQNVAREILVLRHTQ